MTWIKNETKYKKKIICIQEKKRQTRIKKTYWKCDLQFKIKKKIKMFFEVHFCVIENNHPEELKKVS